MPFSWLTTARGAVCALLSMKSRMTPFPSSGMAELPGKAKLGARYVGEPLPRFCWMRLFPILQQPQLRRDVDCRGARRERDEGFLLALERAQRAYARDFDGELFLDRFPHARRGVGAVDDERERVALLHHADALFRVERVVDHRN